MLSAPNRSVEIVVRYAFVPLLAVGGGGAIVALAPSSKLGVVVVVVAVVVLDLGITIVHWWSHRSDWLWRSMPFITA